MEIEEPIQQLLKNTGWSCEDLLAKLQQYKSLKDSNTRDPSIPEIRNLNASPTEECVVDSTEEIIESDISEVQNLESNNDLHKTNENPSEKIDESVNNSLSVDNGFSDTDEEEVEVNATNTSIINEIIDDISSTENLEATDKNNTHGSEGDKDDTTEVTEVRVIEIDTDDDDDDCFEEVHSKISNTIKKFEYRETYPRKIPLASKEFHEKKFDVVTIPDDEDCEISENTNQENCSQDQSCKSKNTNHTNNDSSEISNIQVDRGQDNLVNETNDEHSLPLMNPISSNENCINNDLEKDVEHLEDIRNNLKLQLNCLRNRKRSHFLQGLRMNVTDDSEKKKNISKDKIDKSVPKSNTAELNTLEKNELRSISKVCTNNSKENKVDDDLYTQTNEFGLVILNVQGGIDIDNIENSSCSKISVPEVNLNENSSNTIDSLLENTIDFNDSNSFPSENNTLMDKDEIDPKGVFDEIRKIIRKQKNTFNKNRKYNYSLETNNRNKFVDNEDTSEGNMGSLNFETIEKRINSYETSTLSTENSLSSFAADDTNQTADKNSPFISNTLDEFLTGNSKLNISYKVPKSGAEEGLTDSYHEESPLVLKKVIKVDQSPKPKREQTIKAKTVAQKRKILERQRLRELKMSQIEFDKGLNQNKIIIENKIGNKENASIIKNKNENKQEKDSFIIVNNKKIWVKSTLSDTCIAKLISKKSSPIKTAISSQANKDKKMVTSGNQKQRKLSLLNDMEKKYKQQIKYRPGPLSKKPNLQVSGRDYWKTEMRVLPKVFLEITPKIGYPIPSYIRSRLPKTDGRLSENQIEFALSVLKTNESNVKHKIFKFPVSYNNNQEHIIIRKQKISTNVLSNRKLHSEQKSDNNIIADVIDDLIKYVEIKEIAPTLIKEEEQVEYEKTDGVVYPKMPAIPENVSSIFKKPQKKRSRVELELSRLSCKVVNVEVEESSTEEYCSKPYCQLGCVCKSLNYVNLTYHCQKVECMLECTCPKEKPVTYDKLTLPAGTDILSTDAVNRIQDEAKKDLAKVEREFTQTVIHTNDKTIVVGLGGRNKTRRAKKTPKKYSDCIESFEPVKVVQKVRDIQKCDFMRNCFVSIERLNLPGIIPYCLTHNSYDCQCEGKSSFTSNCATTKPVSEDVSPSPTPIVEEKVEPRERKKAIGSKKYIRKVKEPRVNNKQDVHNEPRVNDKQDVHNESDRFNSSTDKDTDAIGEDRSSTRPIRIIKKPKLNDDFSYSDEVSFYNSDCARVRGRRLESPILLGKCPASSIRNRGLLQKDDFINNITDSDILKANNIDDRQLLEVDLLKIQLIAEAKRKFCALIAKNSYNEKNKHKRKQTLEIRSDENNIKSGFKQGLAIQRRKRIGPLTRRISIEPVFDGEIIIDKRNMDLLKKMGPRTVSEGYARLLPWKVLTESFRNGTIKIWCMIDQPSRLLINKSDKFPPRNYVNIRHANQSSEVVLWILNNKLPSTYHEDNISFILKQTKDNYEICGLCTKFTENTVVSETVTQDENISEKPEEDLSPFKHKDLNGISQLLYIKMSTFKLQELIEEDLAGIGETSVDKNKLYMWAALPEIYKVCKWRMIFLNSDFTYLYFTNLKYSIKYTDLVVVDNMAKARNSTIILRNEAIQQAYDHSAFGIYFDPHYQDRLFIGPYFKQFNGDDIETLRYINKSLVCTESFNKMQGKMNYKCGHWLIERPYGYTRRPPEIDQTIDLTNDNDEVTSTNDEKKKSDDDMNEEFKRPKCAFKSYGKENVVILHNNTKIKVIDSVPRKPQDFNRYIITNIPHFGYLGAYHHSASNEIDVSWPFENKLLRFPTVRAAIDFLQERLSSLLQPIPETFKINVIVLTSIDLESSHPINASILTGHYICGEFGCYNVKTITDEFCVENLGTTKEEILKIFAKRAQAFIKLKIEELASLLLIPKTDLGLYDIINILDMAKKEITEQTELEKRNTAEKNSLLLRKRELAVKTYSMISTLPEQWKQAENLKFREILSKRSFTPHTTITEPIEIHDSDEEENKPTADKSIPMECNQPVPEPPNNKILDQNLNEGHFSLASQAPNSKVHNDVPMLSILKDKSILPSKVAETATAFPQLRKLKLKSVLKPISPLLTKDESSATTASKESVPTAPKSDTTQAPLKSIPTGQFLTGVKIIKTNSGKLVLVSDKDSNQQGKFNPKMGTKVVIKNNRILSIKSLETNKKPCTQPLSVLGAGCNKKSDLGDCNLNKNSVCAVDTLHSSTNITDTVGTINKYESVISSKDNINDSNINDKEDNTVIESSPECSPFKENSNTSKNSADKFEISKKLESTSKDCPPKPLTPEETSNTVPDSTNISDFNPKMCVHNIQSVIIRRAGKRKHDDDNYKRYDNKCMSKNNLQNENSKPSFETADKTNINSDNLNCNDLENESNQPRDDTKEKPCTNNDENYNGDNESKHLRKDDSNSTVANTNEDNVDTETFISCNESNSPKNFSKINKCDSVKTLSNDQMNCENNNQDIAEMACKKSENCGGQTDLAIEKCAES